MGKLNLRPTTEQTAQAHHSINDPRMPTLWDLPSQVLYGRIGSTIALEQKYDFIHTVVLDSPVKTQGPQVKFLLGNLSCVNVL